MKSLKNIPSVGWVIILSIALIALLRLSHIFDSAELLTYDLRYRLRPVQQPLDEIVLITIDDESLKELGTWPLPRDLHAGLVQTLSELGAKAIIFDVLFVEPGSFDDLFAQSIKKSGNVYLPLAFYVPEKERPSQLISSDHEILADVLLPLKQHASGIGHINVHIDKDGKARGVPLFVQEKGALTPQISLLAAARYLGIDINRVEIFDDHLVIADRLDIPVVDKNRFLVNYVGKWNESFRKVPYIQVLREYLLLKEGKIDDIRLDLRGKVCFVGLTATGTSDLRATPLEKLYPMLGVQANIFQNIVEQRFIRDIGMEANIFLNILMFSAGFLFCRRFLPMKALLVIILLGVGYFAVASALFNHAGLWIDVFLPLLIMAATYVGTLGVRFFQERRKRVLLEKELQIAQDIQKSFLPKEIPQIEGLSIDAFLQSSRFVGGDLYDVVKFSPERIGVLIGDVAGKGVSASLVMARMISIFNVLSHAQDNGPGLFHQLNNELCKRVSGRFVTALYVLIDLSTRKAHITSAGHGSLLVSNLKDRQVTEVTLAPSVPLGLKENSAYGQTSIDLREADALVIYSDGVLEARNKRGEEFGIDRIRTLVSQGRSDTGRALLDSLKEALFKFEDTSAQHDDITMLVMSLK